MSGGYEFPVASSLGFPEFPREAIPKCPGKALPWIPGMKTEGADWWLVNYHTGDMRRFGEAGGKYERMVVHFLGYDVGLLEPLWGKDTLLARVERLQDMGVSHIIAPDFSAWSDMPLALQLYNHYRSAVVATDLARLEMKVIPNIAWSTALGGQRTAVSMWGSLLPFYVVDANHRFGKDEQRDAWWRGARMANEANPKAHVWVYAQRQQNALAWGALFARSGSTSQWVPARVKMLAALVKTRNRVLKERLQRRGLKTPA